MAGNSELQSVRNQGRWQGFANLFRKENRLWWGSRRWWVQLLIWLALMNGILFLGIGVAPNAEPLPGSDADGQAALGAGASPEELAVIGLVTFLKLAGIAAAIGVVVLGQETLLNEKHTGTAAWVLSKPVTRGAVIMSKLLSYSFGILVTMVVTQGVIAYLIIWLITGVAMPILPFAGALGILFLALLFWLTFTVMLSALTNSRGVVLGVALFLVLAFVLVGMLPTWISDFMPWNLTSDMSPTRPALAGSLAMGQALPTLMPFIASAVWCVLFAVIAIWRFRREEF